MKVKGILFSISMLSLLLGGCASQKFECYDEFTGTTTQLSKSKYVSAGGLKSVELQAYREEGPNVPESYGLIAKVYRPVFDELNARPANILDGQSLYLLVDGDTYAYTTYRGGGEKKLTAGLLCGYFQESARYPNIPRADIVRLATACEIKMKVETEEGDYVGELGPKAQNYLVDFIHEYLEADNDDVADISIP